MQHCITFSAWDGKNICDRGMSKVYLIRTGRFIIFSALGGHNFLTDECPRYIWLRLADSLHCLNSHLRNDPRNPFTYKRDTHLLLSSINTKTQAGSLTENWFTLEIIYSSVIFTLFTVNLRGTHFDCGIDFGSLLGKLEASSEFKLFLSLLLMAPFQGDPVHRLHHVRRARRGGEGGGGEGGVWGGRRLRYGPRLPDHLRERLFLMSGLHSWLYLKIWTYIVIHQIDDQNTKGVGL